MENNAWAVLFARRHPLYALAGKLPTDETVYVALIHVYASAIGRRENSGNYNNDNLRGVTSL